MKSLIWKIIALVSVFIGSLGPQIAAGSQAEAQPEPVAIQQVELIPVVTAASATRIVIGDAGVACESSGLQLGRFDLLLWSDCDASLAIGTVETDQDIIVAAPTSLPELTVETGSHKSITSTYDVWTGSDTVSGAFAYQADLETKTKNSLSVRQLSLGTTGSVETGFSSDNSQDTVVLRC